MIIDSSDASWRDAGGSNPEKITFDGRFSLETCASQFCRSFRDLLNLMKNAERFVCIHGHFYQPPRENPWLEKVELQDSAFPFHDWNERITAECYAPNAVARILGPEGKIRRLANNYSPDQLQLRADLAGLDAGTRA